MGNAKANWTPYHGVWFDWTWTTWFINFDSTLNCIFLIFSSYSHERHTLAGNGMDIHKKRLIDFFTWPKCNTLPSINSKFLLLWLYSVNIIAHSTQCENSKARKLVPPATIEWATDRQTDGWTYGKTAQTEKQTIFHTNDEEKTREQGDFWCAFVARFIFTCACTHTLRNIFWLILNFSVRRSTNDEKWHFEWILIDTNLFINDVIQSIRAKWKHHQSRTHTNTHKNNKQ